MSLKYTWEEKGSDSKVCWQGLILFPLSCKDQCFFIIINFFVCEDLTIRLMDSWYFTLKNTVYLKEGGRHFFPYISSKLRVVHPLILFNWHIGEETHYLSVASFLATTDSDVHRECGMYMRVEIYPIGCVRFGGQLGRESRRMLLSWLAQLWKRMQDSVVLACH